MISRVNKRDRWLRGRRACVDDIDFVMPVENDPSPALTAVFTIDAAKAAAALPGQELHPLSFRGKGLLAVAVIDYQGTSIGTYVEFCLGVVCTKGPRPRSALTAALFRERCGTGIYICDLPVSSEISVKGGRGIWGMAKRQANLDFVVGESMVSSQYSLDGQLVARIDVPKPQKCRLPVRVSGVGYGAWRGMLTRSRVRMRGAAGLAWPKRTSATLIFGDHPRADAFRALGVSDTPLFTCFMPSASGVLDDYVESWFLTGNDEAPKPDFDLDDVVDLTTSDERLGPPNRDETDTLVAAQLATRPGD